MDRKTTTEAPAGVGDQAELRPPQQLVTIEALKCFQDTEANWARRRRNVLFRVWR